MGLADDGIAHLVFNLTVAEVARQEREQEIARCFPRGTKIDGMGTGEIMNLIMLLIRET